MFDFKCAALILTAVFCIIAALFILKRRNELVKKKTDYKMSGYRIIYADSSQSMDDENVETGRLLYSERLDIQGKPDFVFKHSITGGIVPVEIKSGNIKAEAMPHMGDLMQLVCYFYIAEEEFGRKVKYGKIIYKDYMFEVKNTAHLRKQLEKTTADMRKMLKCGKAKANADYITCRHCVCAGTVCRYCKIEE